MEASDADSDRLEHNEPVFDPAWKAGDGDPDLEPFGAVGQGRTKLPVVVSAWQDEIEVDEADRMTFAPPRRRAFELPMLVMIAVVVASGAAWFGGANWYGFLLSSATSTTGSEPDLSSSVRDVDPVNGPPLEIGNVTGRATPETREVERNAPQEAAAGAEVASPSASSPSFGLEPSSAPVAPAETSASSAEGGDGERGEVAGSTARELHGSSPSETAGKPEVASSLPGSPEADQKPSPASAAPGRSTASRDTQAPQRTAAVTAPAEDLQEERKFKPSPETKPTTIPGWRVLEVIGDTVVLEGPNGVWRVKPGDSVPGVGNVDSVVHWGPHLLIVTQRGLIGAR